MPRLPTLFLLLAVAVLLCGTVSVDAAPNPDSQHYRKAFSLLDSNHPDQAYAFAHGHDAVLNKILRGYYLAIPGNNESFETLAAFIAENPNWPNLRGLLTNAEQKIPPNSPPSNVVSWFVAHPPLTTAGFYRYIDALDAVGQTENVEHMIRARWIHGDFSDDEAEAFYSRYANFLTADSNWARLDDLLWKNHIASAHTMYPYVDANRREVAEARLALANKKSNGMALAANVSSEWRNDPGLLYEMLRSYVHDDLDDQAVDVLGRMPEDPMRPDLWWDQREIMVRRLIKRHDFDTAFKLASNPGKLEGRALLQSEFLTGWLALRFLNQPDIAREHFETLFESAITPISRARGAYWLGRTYEVLGDKESAEQAYENAATLNVTYYGQLAIARLYANPVMHAAPEPAIPAGVSKAFYNRDLITAVERLYELNENDRARIFFQAATEAAQSRVEFTLLTELAYRIGRPDLAIVAVKAANQKNMLIAAGGFPLLDRKVPKPPEPAFTHAIIRQESMFNPNANSVAGARGLMQLMPATAKAVARSLNVRYKEKRLNDSDYSLLLGTAFIQSQIDNFNGSYVLALAGYNAGPHRVREWMEDIGDPRSPSTDPVDWVEMIPLMETRNYVQRIIESLQVYRARLNGGQSPLLILKDLRR